MMNTPRWKNLMFAASLAVLPACGGMEEAQSPESQGLDTKSPMELGQKRAELALGTTTTWLPARGDNGGSAGGIACPANSVAVGIQGTLDAYVNSIGLLCRTLNADGSLGATSSTPVAGSQWGTGFSRQCPDGMAIVGFPGHTGWYADSLGLYCAAPSAWMTSATVQSTVAETGSSSANPFSDVCPAQQVVTQLAVRNGDVLDQEQALCTRMVAGPPASCQDLKTANPSAADGAYTLYFGRDQSKPWTVWCQNMASTPTEYLSLPSAGPSANFSQYTAGANNSGGTNVRTVFSKVRIDPSTLAVSTGDWTFSSSSGYLTHPYNTPVSFMPYAVAMNCDYGNPGLGNIDLRGTPFAVAANQFVAGGWYPSGSANYSSNNQVVDLQGFGNCGWMSVQGASEPYNNRSFSLQLQYAPPPPPVQPRSGSFTYNASNTNSATQNTTPYDVTLTAGQTIQFGTTGVAGASGSGDTYLQLYGPSGALVAANDDANGTVLSFVSYTAPQAGTYRIQAGCYSTSTCGGTVAYTLQ